MKIMTTDPFADFEAICRREEPLAGHTWYRLGGPARWFLTPRNELELSAVLARCRRREIPWRVLGRGANVLVREAGFPGAVVQLSGPAWERVGWPGPDDPPLVQAASGADFIALVKEAVDRGLSGLERLAGIPGLLGGIIRMNAGGKYGSICELTVSAEILEADGRRRIRTAAEVGFGYRHTDLAGCVVLGATLRLNREAPETARKRYLEIWQEKYSTQPPLKDHSAGCIFRNPPNAEPGGSAGALIDRAGLKGFRHGGAQISPRHANFIVAGEGASSSDVLALIELAQVRVYERFGVRLETEVEIW